MTYRQIAIPTDGSELSGRAISWGVTLAKVSEASIELINVAVPSRLGDELRAAGLDAADKIPRLTAADRRIKEDAARVARTGLTVTTTVLTGPVPSALAEYLERSKADLMVMATHDPGAVERVLVGSVAESVIRHSSKPVLLIHQHDGVDSSSAVTIRRILVPLDGSEFSERILPHATELAATMKAELMLLCVLVPMMAIAATGLGESVAGVPAPIESVPTDDDAVKTERARIEAQASQLESTTGLTVSGTILVHGNAGHAIVDYAREHSIDVIAMSTHGRGALKRLMMGSVATHVLHASPSAMLVCNPEHR